MSSIRLNVQELERMQKEKGWDDTELAKRIGVARTTLWRVRLPIDDPRYNAPGEAFIAGVLSAFHGSVFEDLFFLADVMRDRNIDFSDLTSLSTGTLG